MKKKLVGMLCVLGITINCMGQELATATAPDPTPELTPQQFAEAMQKKNQSGLVLSENDLDAIALKVAEAQRNDDSQSWTTRHPVLTWMAGIAAVSLAAITISKANKSGDNTYNIEGSYVDASSDGDGNDSVSVDSNDGTTSMTTGGGGSGNNSNE